MVFEVLKAEKKSGELVVLSKDFYEETAKLLAQTKDPTEKQNIGRTIDSIKEKRTQKILVYVAYNKELPNQPPHEEEDLYNQITKIVKREARTTNQTKVRITADVPELITTKGNRIGPFKQNEIVSVGDGDDTKFIIENRIGEIV